MAQSGRRCGPSNQNLARSLQLREAGQGRAVKFSKARDSYPMLRPNDLPAFLRTCRGPPCRVLTPVPPGAPLSCRSQTGSSSQSMSWLIGSGPCSVSPCLVDAAAPKGAQSDCCDRCQFIRDKDGALMLPPWIPVTASAPSRGPPPPPPPRLHRPRLHSRRRLPRVLHGVSCRCVRWPGRILPSGRYWLRCSMGHFPFPPLPFPSPPPLPSHRRLSTILSLRACSSLASRSGHSDRVSAFVAQPTSRCSGAKGQE